VKLYLGVFQQAVLWSVTCHCTWAYSSKQCYEVWLVIVPGRIPVSSAMKCDLSLYLGVFQQAVLRSVTCHCTWACSSKQCHEVWLVIETPFSAFLFGFFSPENMGAISDEHGERFHQDVSQIKKRDAVENGVQFCRLTTAGVKGDTNSRKWGKRRRSECLISLSVVNGKTIPLQARRGPEGSRSLRLPDFKTVGTWRW
jgi:hypothetical protein